MNKYCSAAVIGIAFGLCTPASAATDAECEVLWKKPDVSVSGKLSPTYSQAFTKSGRALPADGIVGSAAFMDACKAGAFNMASMAPEPGAPFPGANSYTEAQARGHIENAGFTAVNGLKKDDQGIWQATAMKAGKSVTVALDFKGNVVAK